MPKLPRVSGAEIVRALQRLGFEKVRQSGSHVVMRRGSKGCVVPMHAEVKVGTLAGVLRQANMIMFLYGCLFVLAPEVSFSSSYRPRAPGGWRRPKAQGGLKVTTTKDGVFSLQAKARCRA